MQDLTVQDFDFIQPSSKYLDIDGKKLRAARIKVCPKLMAFAVACGWSHVYQVQLERPGRWSVPKETAGKLMGAILHFSGGK